VLYIYQHRASPFWWVRYWERGRTYRCSTRTEDRITAIAFAKQYFSDIKQRIRQGPTATRSASAYDTLLNSLLASERAKLGRGELTQITYDNMVYRFDKKITPFFSGWDITEINYQQVSEFLNQISEDDLTSSTISAYVRLVRKLLQHAARQGVITAVPEIGEAPLSAGEVTILSAFARAPGRSLERWQLLEVIGSDTPSPPSAGTIEMRITRLRKKLTSIGAEPPGIKAIHKVGYTLCAPIMLT
jgi:hypothetical protein